MTTSKKLSLQSQLADLGSTLVQQLGGHLCQLRSAPTVIITESDRKSTCQPRPPKKGGQIDKTFKA
jgi:hypothetical protein